MKPKYIIPVFAVTFLTISVSTRGQFLKHGKYSGVKLLEAVGDSAGSRLGYGVAGIGDQNGDGYDDIIAGASGDQKVYLYYGGSPMDSIPDMVLRSRGNDEILTSRLSYAGDVNGDEAGDFMIYVSRYYAEEPGVIYIYFGGPLLDTIPNVILVGENFLDGFGCSLSTAGDVNSDGYDDVIVSAVNYPNETMQGKVYIFLGGPDMDSIPDWTVVGDSARSGLGISVSGGGDINGDGYDDVVIGGMKGTPSPDYFRLYFGGQEMDTIPDFVLDEEHLSYRISSEVSVIGDVNGDEYADIICGGGYWDSLGYIYRAYIFYGGQEVDTIPDVILEDGNVWWGPQGPFPQAGDINRDGYADVLAGNPSGFGDLGAVLVYLGGRIMDGKLDVGFNGFSGSYEGCGKSVGRAGDVNGNGIDDILFGAPGLYTPPYENSEGRVMVFSGDTTLNYVQEEKGGLELPREVSLRQNFPNPFNATTLIRYTLSAVRGRPSAVTLRIYNLLGQEVKTLVDKLQKGGRYEVTWDGKDEEGREVGSGVYFCQLRVQTQKGGVAQKTRKLLLIR